VVIDAGAQATLQPSGDFADEAFANAVLKHDLAADAVEAHEFGRDATAARPSSPPPHLAPPRTACAPGRWRDR
jgi:hypothetical protein